MNFEEIKKKTEAFVRDELFTLEPWILNVEWKEKLPKLNELREKYYYNIKQKLNSYDIMDITPLC